MRKLFTTIAMVGVLSGSLVSGANATAVPGYETQYDDVLAVCQLPEDDRPPALVVAINAYSSALITGGVPQDVALQSFQELRDEYEALCGTAATDAIFEELLPDTAAVIIPEEPVDPGTPGDTPSTPS